MCTKTIWLLKFTKAGAYAVHYSRKRSPLRKYYYTYSIAYHLCGVRVLRASSTPANGAAMVLLNFAAAKNCSRTPFGIGIVSGILAVTVLIHCFQWRKRISLNFRADVLCHQQSKSNQYLDEDDCLCIRCVQLYGKRNQFFSLLLQCCLMRIDAVKTPSIPKIPFSFRWIGKYFQQNQLQIIVHSIIFFQHISSANRNTETHSTIPYIKIIELHSSERSLHAFLLPLMSNVPIFGHASWIRSDDSLASGVTRITVSIMSKFRIDFFTHCVHTPIKCIHSARFATFTGIRSQCRVYFIKI